MIHKEKAADYFFRLSGMRRIYNMDYMVRNITIDDYDSIYELWNSTEQSRRALNPVDDSRDGIERYLKRNPGTCFAAVKDGKVQVPLADIFGLPSLFYTGEEFRQHLAAALHRFKTSDDYDIVLLPPESADPSSGNTSSQSFSVVVNEAAGVILYRSFAPSTLFYTREQDMTLSFWEYLERFEKNAGPRKVTMEKLEHYLDKLEKALR